MARVFLGIDLGTSAVKAVLVDEEGIDRAEGTAALGVDRPAPGAAEQDPGAWWAAAQVAVAEARARAPGTLVAGVGLTGQKHALLPPDKAGRPLGRAWLWCDGRAAPEAARLAARVPDLGRRTGAGALPGYLVPKWHAWKARNPAEAGRTRRLCFAKDWLRRRLTGAWATDPSEASAAQVLDARTRTWSPELGRLLDLPLDLLPPVLPSGATSGVVREGGVAGLDAGVPVVAGAGDNEAAALACGVLEPGVAVVVLGTSASILARVPRRRVPSGLVAGDAGFVRAPLATGVVLDAGGALAWLAQTVFAPEGDVGAVLDAAASVAPGPDVPLFLPALAGARSPRPRSEAHGAFVGLGARTGRAHLARAVAEGVAAQVGRTVDALRGAGARVESLRLASGGAASPFLRRLVAAAAALPAERVGTRAATARGAALLAARRDEPEGALVEAARAWCRPEPAELPDPATQRRLAEVKERLEALERRLDDRR